jgi:hypothetical protein
MAGSYILDENIWDCHDLRVGAFTRPFDEAPSTLTSKDAHRLGGVAREIRSRAAETRCSGVGRFLQTRRVKI